MKIRQLVWAALFAACASWAAAEVVLEREGELAEGDSTLEDGRYVDWYKVPMTAGTRYLLTAQSDELDTSMLLRFADKARLGDFGRTAAALVYTAVRSESVEVGVANSLDPESGPYTVTVEKIPAGRSVQAGQKLSRSLGADLAGKQGWRTDSLLLTGSKGDRIVIRAKSADFAPVLRVQNRAGYRDEAENPDDKSATLGYVFSEQGQIEIVVRPGEPGEGGQYELEVERQAPARVLQAGAVVQGTLGQDRDLYLLEGKRGRAVTVGVESEDFDATVQVTDRLGRRAVNDDYGEGTSARLLHVFADDAPVAVAVGRTGEGDKGSYRLSIAAVDYDAATLEHEDLSLLASGEVVNGNLSATDLLRHNRYVHRYTFEAERNQVVRLELTSQSFDASLEVVGPNRFEASDDDSLGGTNALVQTVCREEGTYTVRVTSAADWATGMYELAFSNKGEARALLEREGVLESKDPRDISGRFYDTYVVEVDEGSSFSVEMSSTDLDSYLYVWDPKGTEVYSDDDGGGETNARVTVDSAAGGKWTMYATSSDKGQTGAYSLRVLTY